MPRLFAKKLSVEEIEEIVERKRDWVLKNSNPLAIYLFGSAHSATMTVASDVDLLLVFEDNQNLDQVREQLARTRPKDDWPHDLLSFHKSEFLRKSQRMGSICHEVIHFGRIIYGEII